MKKNAFYAQSGGVTSVINATAAALILESKKYQSKIGKVYAGKNGILGALKEELFDTSISNTIPFRTGDPKETASLGIPPGTRERFDGFMVVRSSNDSLIVSGSLEKPSVLPRNR